MRFSCGLTDEEYWRRQGEWHPWFAWRPVTIAISEAGEKQCVWLCWVERRRWRDPYTIAEYRECQHG